MLPATHQNQIYSAQSGLGVRVDHSPVELGYQVEGGLDADIVQFFITVFYLAVLHIGQHNLQNALKNVA